MGGVGEEGTSSGSVDNRRFTELGFPEESDQGRIYDLYTELWHACAGPHAYLPRTGDRVMYFPQGHLEEVEEYINSEGGKLEMPIYNVPSKILCRVVYVALKADANTDEVYSQLTLVPELKQDDSSDGENAKSRVFPKPLSHSFSKRLTPSDTSTHGGFSVPKKNADECLPKLIKLSELPHPTQDLVAKDLHGQEWRFRHVYRGQPKRHLFTTGWSNFVSLKKLEPGDAFIFLRGENGELRVGIRRSKLPRNAAASVISGHSMQHAILASTFHAISARSIFTVNFRPWTSPDFVVPLDRYVRSAEIDFAVGTRVRLQFEEQENQQERRGGVIVGIEDIDKKIWPDSEWRCLKVKWDDASDEAVRPERVNPWNVEPIEVTKRKQPSILRGQKRFRAQDDPSASSSGLTRDVEHASSSHQKVLHGQEGSNFGVNHVGIPQILTNQSLAPIPQFQDLFNLPNAICNTTPSPGENMASIGLPNQWLPALFSPGAYNNASSSREFPPQEWRGFEQRHENNEGSISDANGSGGRYMLFGVELVTGKQELPSPPIFPTSQPESFSSIPPTSQSSMSETVQALETLKRTGIPSVRQCKNCSSITYRTCTKVLKFGAALGRSVDLTRFNSYEELILELDRMFDFRGTLSDGTSGWHVTYTDDEGDTMLIGDYPWQEFRFVVRKMHIYPREEIEKMRSSSHDPFQ